MFLLLFLLSLICNFTNANYKLDIAKSAFDTSLYENALDAAECGRQMSLIQSDLNLRLLFLDAGLRIPKSITQGNMLDMGDYYGCLGIQQIVDNSTIQGKYCMIDLLANRENGFRKLTELPGFSEISEGLMENGTLSEKVKSIRDKQSLDRVTLLYKLRVTMIEVLKSSSDNSTSPINLRMAMCIPKACTVSEGLEGLYNDATMVGFRYQEEFCRLPNDKPWAPADYVAIVLFSAIGILTLLSTLYDLRNQLILLRDPKSVNPLYISFSVYTNARRLTTFTKNPTDLECVDGVRALSMAWVTLFHTFSRKTPVLKVTDYWNWRFSLRSIWLTSGLLAVDTFLMMSGMLLVYTKAGRLTSSKLIRNLHLFYLNRILRMFPLLAANILIQASFFHWISDGPLWQDIASATDACRNLWWINLLYLNNFFRPNCLSVSWYLAVDMQLHILSPILLYFVLSNSRRQAYAALVGGLLATLAASTIYVFIKQLPGATEQPGRLKENSDYGYQYYSHTLPRAAPFLVGMMFGYILHLCRQRKPKFSKITVLLLWFLIIVMGALSLYSPEPMKDVNHDNQTLDSLVNAFSRPAWALAVASVVVMSVNGYGGPVNWFLSLHLWKLTSRISYAIYLFHYSLIMIINGSLLQPVYFSVFGTLYAFFSVFSISFIIGFFATLVIDLPFSIIFNQLLGGGLRKPQQEISQHNNTLRDEVQRGN